MNVFDFFSRTQIVEDIIDKIYQLADQILYGHFFLLAKIEEFAVEAVADRPPFVLLNQPTMIQAETEVFLYQHGELGDDRLEQSRDGDSVVDPGRDVTDPEFK